MEHAPGGQQSPTAETDPADSLTSRSRRVSEVSFAAILDERDRHRVCWTAPEGLELVGCGVAASITARGDRRIERIRTSGETVFDDLCHHGEDVARPRAFGGLSFSPAGSGRPTGTADSPEAKGGGSASSPWGGFGDARFVVPRVQLTRADAGTWLTVVGSDDDVDDRLDDWQTRLERAPPVSPIGSPTAIASRERTTDREGWRTQVDDALAAIETTDLEKVVLAQALTAELETPIELATTLERLRRRYPECYRFAFDGRDGSTFFGAPPERLVATDDRALETEALAGSVPRGETPDEDESHATRLRNSEKLDAEHEFVVEAIESQLSTVTESVTVEPRTIKRLATIQHLQTPMTGRLADGAHVLDVVAALHPTPAVGGVPQRIACETIRSIEPMDRGWYAAPVGWFDANGDGEFAVAIRSAVTNGSTMTLFAGNGIVEGADAGEEWDEIELKFRSILDEFR